MPEKARIFLAEDHDLVRKQEKALLTELGHTVEIEATSLEEALTYVKLAKEKRVNVAVLDGCLSKGVWKADCETIAAALRKEIPDIKIITCSFVKQTCGDANLLKEDLEKLGDVVEAL